MSNEPDDTGVIDSPVYILDFENIDTDQIIPAQFLTTTEREGLGQFCFYNWRYDDDGNPRASHPLDRFDPDLHEVLVAGPNFGCGSSREHAPWGLLDMGVRAVISSRFADIFRNNSLKNGLLPVQVDQAAVDFLIEHPDHRVRIDIAGAKLHVPDLGEFDFPLDPFPAHCLAQGIDQLDYLLQHEAEIAQYEQRIEH